jgi:ADP-heptose:LPS heptosyltransferase
VPHVADALLTVLAPLGIATQPGEGRCDLPVLPNEPVVGFPAGTTPVAVAPATNMPCKRWPTERYFEVLRGLATSVPIHPVLFGGAGDRKECEQLLAALAIPGTLVVGESIAYAAAAMRACAMYLGNDTGVMHLAAAVGKPCVAVFSARDVPGAWYPYGVGHRVFRTPLPCDACFGHACPLGTRECILRIEAPDVLRACRELIGSAGRTG